MFTLLRRPILPLFLAPMAMIVPTSIPAMICHCHCFEKINWYINNPSNFNYLLPNHKIRTLRTTLRLYYLGLDQGSPLVNWQAMITKDWNKLTFICMRSSISLELSFSPMLLKSFLQGCNPVSGVWILKGTLPLRYSSDTPDRMMTFTTHNNLLFGLCCSLLLIFIASQNTNP